MRKCLFLLMCVALLGCSKQVSIVGSWVSSSSKHYDDNGVESNGGTVRTETFDEDGAWNSEIEVQFYIGSRGATVTAYQFGTWKMEDEHTLFIHVDRELLSSGDDEAVSMDLERTIITLDNDHFEYMEKGKKHTLVRK